MKRILVAAVAVVLLFPALVVTPVAAHGNQACLDANAVSGLISGAWNSSPNYYRNGARAAIDLHHDVCGNGLDDDDHAVSAWVALTPRIGTATQIAQVGILECRSTGFPGNVCTEHPNELRYFGGAGGCTNNILWDMGPATNGFHNFTVEKKADGIWFYAPGATSFIDRNDQRIFCWYGVNLQAQFGVEKFDRGDSSGGDTTRTRFDNMEYRSTQSSSWFRTVWPSGDCYEVMQTAPHTSYCTMSASDMWAWD
jgi:hypothetical protein